ncbi:hypothetical protein BDR04DRAFT_993567, partial [Suillus decipiens]
HVMLHNIIECIFGMLKSHFKILLLPPHYTMDVQAHIPLALCLVHNVIHLHNPDDMLDYCQVNIDDVGPYDIGMLAQGPPNEEACTRLHDHHNAIAHQMWEHYNRVQLKRGL